MAPKFVKFVRSVEGHAVARYGSGSRTTANELIGATRVDVDRIEWDTERVTPLTEEYCAKYSRELRRSLKLGELVEVTEDDYLAYVTEPEPKPEPKPEPEPEPVTKPDLKPATKQQEPTS